MELSVYYILFVFELPVEDCHSQGRQLAKPAKKE